jgi:hypothetical protein
MPILRWVVLISIVAAPLLHCVAPAGPSDALVPTVAAAERTAAGIVRFHVDWRNVGTVPLYLDGCGGEVSMWLERRGTRWEAFGGGICPANLGHTRVRLDSGQSLHAAVGVGPGEAGEYRAVISATDDGGKSALVRSSGVYLQ